MILTINSEKQYEQIIELIHRQYDVKNSILKQNEIFPYSILDDNDQEIIDMIDKKQDNVKLQFDTVNRYMVEQTVKDIKQKDNSIMTIKCLLSKKNFYSLVDKDLLLRKE